MDSYGILKWFRDRVVITAADTNPINVQLMKRLPESYNNGECPKSEAEKEDVEEEKKNHIRKVTVRHAEFKIEDVPRIDVLYLDPLWPKEVGGEYKIGEQTLVQVVEGVFEKDHALKMVICKVSSEYDEHGHKKGPTLKEQLMKLKVTIGTLRVEEFFPIAGSKEQEDGKPDKKLECVHVLKRGETSITIPGWNNDWNEKISGFPQYSGTIRFIFITRHPKDKPAESEDQAAVAQQPLRSLDVSIFL